MKIGIDAMLLSGTFSGVEQYILNVCRAFPQSESDLSVTVFAPRGFKDEKVTSNNSVKIENALISGKSRTVRIFWEQFWLPFKVFSYKFDLMHFPGYIHPYVKGIPTVLTVHDIIAITAPELCKKTNKYYYQKFLKRSVNRATRIITPTDRVKEELWRFFKKPKAQIDVIPMGTDMVELCPIVNVPVREKYGIGKEPYVLFVGNIEPKKGVWLLIKGVFAALMHKNLPHKLVIAGQRAWKSKHVFKLINELGESFKERVIFTGYIEREDICALYKEAELFVFPSLLEGFGIPPLEAMSCGTPVLVSSEPSLSETYTGSAHFFKIGDLKELREKIEFLLENDSERNKYTDKGLQLAHSLTWKKCMERTLETYRKAEEDFKEES
jgi:glycosyltransferase involved in cell wall biosynthesis